MPCTNPFVAAWSGAVIDAVLPSDRSISVLPLTVNVWPSQRRAPVRAAASVASVEHAVDDVGVDECSGNRRVGEDRLRRPGIAASSVARTPSACRSRCLPACRPSIDRLGELRVVAPEDLEGVLASVPWSPARSSSARSWSVARSSSSTVGRVVDVVVVGARSSSSPSWSSSSRRSSSSVPSSSPVVVVVGRRASSSPSSSSARRRRRRRGRRRRRSATSPAVDVVVAAASGRRLSAPRSSPAAAARSCCSRAAAPSSTTATSAAASSSTPLWSVAGAASSCSRR